jgi:transketolase
MDAVQKARSGHPGAPMGMADFAEVLWNDFLRHNPVDPSWPDRDRVLFSNGHGSMLIYSLLHLSGYDISIDDIKNFRTLGSKTPGHPEHGMTPGVESTSGPLGQGIACGVGMALAERLMAETFNRDGFPIVDHHSYVFMGDGCMMEGISHECCSLAGTLGLGKLIALYDDNGISIDGCVEDWFTDDTASRFQAYDWHVIDDVDGHDPEAVKAALTLAHAETERPSLICFKTIIGCGAPGVCGTEKCHGAPLGEEEIAAARKELNWEHGPFEIPKDIYDAWDVKAEGTAAQQAWNDLFDEYEKAHPEDAAEFKRRMAGELPGNFQDIAAGLMKDVVDGKADLATRKSSQKAIEAFAPELPEMIGGSADLSGSNGTLWSGSQALQWPDIHGNYINYGVREFAMAAVMNGMSLHGGFIPYGGTFLVFSDYERNAIRMAALMGLKVAHVLTHDSIGVGEDGPTHQPIEHTASLRMIPGLKVWRPCDTVEAAAAWTAALTDACPTCLILSRQTLAFQERSPEALEKVARGAYILSDSEGEPEVLLLATGSEVDVCSKAAEVLRGEGRAVRVVSMPCLETFEAQDEAYKDTVLSEGAKVRIAVEAGVTDGWYKYVGRKGRVIGMDRFGESAPGKVLFEHFGFTVENVVAVAKEMLK